MKLNAPFTGLLEVTQRINYYEKAGRLPILKTLKEVKKRD